MSQELPTPLPEQLKSYEQKEQGEMWRLREVKGGRHVVHPGFDERLGVGDRGASLATQQMVEFVYRWFPKDSLLIVGPHSGPDFSEMVGGDEFVGEDGEIDYKGYLLAHRREIERAKAAMAEKYPRREYPVILFGLEADLGQDQMWPPVDVLRELGQDGPDLVVGSWHYEKIPQEIRDLVGSREPEDQARVGEYFYQGFMHALESGVVHKFGHPLWELHLVRKWDQDKFQQVVDLAKQKSVPFEVTSGRLHQLNADEPTSEVLHALVKNGNLIDFGLDFHSFTGWMKKSAVVPEATRGELTDDNEALLARWEQLDPSRSLSFTKDEKAQLEQVFYRTGVNIGDLKRTLQVVRRLKTQYQLPREQFVNVWPVEDQLGLAKMLI